MHQVLVLRCADQNYSSASSWPDRLVSTCSRCQELLAILASFCLLYLLRGLSSYGDLASKKSYWLGVKPEKEAEGKPYPAIFLKKC